MVQAPAIMPDEARAIALVRDAGVLVHPGYFFDFDRDGYFVVSLLVQPGEFRAGASRMSRDHGPADRPMTRTIHTGRTAGILLPLFSMPSTRSWGIGEIGDLVPMTRWLRTPGSACCSCCRPTRWRRGRRRRTRRSARWRSTPSTSACTRCATSRSFGGEARLDLADQVAIRSARNSTRVDYASVRRVKEHALRMAFSHFWDTEWVRGTARAGSFAAFCSWEEWWLADYALYRALRERSGGKSWTEWEEPLRRRDPDALADARAELDTEILFYQYLQWLADEQWQDARDGGGAGRALRRLPVHGGHRQRRRVGAPAPVPLRRDRRRPARRVQRHRAGLGSAGLPLGRHGPRRLPLAAPARQAQRAPVRRLPHRSPRRLLPHVLAAARQRGGQLRSGETSQTSSRSGSA